MKKDVIRVLTWGGLGDVMLSTPSFESLKNAKPSPKIVVYYRTIPHRDILKNNPFIDELKPLNRIFYVRSFLSSLIRQPKKFITFNYGSLFPSLYYRIPATRIIGEMLGCTVTSSRLSVYLTNEEDQEALTYLARYRAPVIINITSRTSSNQHWPVELWESLIKRVPLNDFIQIGTESENLVKGAVDLRGKTSVRQALALVKHAHSFVGVVSGFSHATNAFGTPGVVLFGPSTPVIWGHTNNINIYKSLACAPCIDSLFKNECPYGTACMKSISVEEVAFALQEQLQRRQPLNKKSKYKKPD